METTDLIRFSCIITCYNRETLIKRAIDSILNQTYQDFEIIVVDDASTDGSVDAIKNISDPRIKLIVHDQNQGQNAAINTGLNHSTFEYVAFLDSDDEWLPEYLRTMALTYTENPTIDFAYSNFINGPKWTLEGSNKYAEALHQGYVSSMITITAKKEAVEKIGRFDRRYVVCQDDDFCFRMAKNFSFKVITDQLAIVHGSENSMSNNIDKVAAGWRFLFENYRNDMINYCGYQTLSKHYLNLSYLYFRAKQIQNGLLFYWKSVANFFKKSNSKKFTFKLIDFLKVNWGILNINFVHIKQYLLKK